MNTTLLSIAKSWHTADSTVNATAELISWVRQRNCEVEVNVRKARLEDDKFWFYDGQEGCIRNQSRSFFTITGFRQTGPDGSIQTQPIIVQPEIGYLGIVCQEIDGIMHFLMQAKIEPGNVNKIQISPTLQATKSNFTLAHGGATPPYLDYFLNAGKYEIVVDQLQSEQASRFYKKRNRNILIRVDEDIPVLPTHRWMTLGQLKALMRMDNLVNMDTRTILSCIPYAQLHLPLPQMQELSNGFRDAALFRSVFADSGHDAIPGIYQYLNHWKMFSETHSQFVPLHQLEDWEMRDGEFVCKRPYPFKVAFYDITIAGREVTHWTQPLFEAIGPATFGLICCEIDGVLKFLVKAMPEIGSFDGLELGPTIQREAAAFSEDDAITSFFMKRLEGDKNVMFDHLLSEEGGRFYHEQNRNVLLKVSPEELPPLPSGYFLLDYRTLNRLVQTNNTLNIQLRNLLSLLEA
ncbi:MAG: dNDP-4-keto-6-deoxy-glucose-2,3- dehydratase [Clostridiales bacterium]|nr:dNDP-4-keto-6-deoxy-glucose-2,3- dehydratase [Clostridiales bacterium]